MPKSDLTADFDSLKGIRDCCRDEAAFDTLKQILATAGHRLEDIVAQLKSSHSPPQLLESTSCHRHLLQGVARATNQLLTNSNFTEAVNQAIATLGQVTAVERVYIFETHPHPETHEPAMSKRFEWLAVAGSLLSCPEERTTLSQISQVSTYTSQNADVEMQPIYPLQNISFATCGLSRWYEVLSAGESISGISREFPAAERELLEYQQIISILIVPIFISEQLSGFIAFDDCRVQRRWSNDEEAVLMTMAANLGGVMARQRTETALQQSESRFQRMVANVPGMIYQFLRRPDGYESILFASSGYQELYELDSEEIHADFQLIKNLIHPDDLPEYQESVNLSADTLQPWTWEGRMITPQGKLKWLQCASRPQQQANGDVLWDGVVMDVTARKQAEEAFQRERRLFMGGPVTVFRWLAQENWPVDYVSSNVTQFGYQPDEFTSGKVTYASIMHPEDVARVDAEIAAYWAAGVQSFEQDYRLIRADGKIRWVCDFRVVVGNDSGEVLHHEGYVLDITERKAAEEALKESEGRYRTLYNNTPVMLHSIDRNGCLTNVSDYWLACLGYERDEVIGRKSTEFMTEESRRYAQEVALPTYFQTGVGKDISYQFVKKNGQLIDVLLSAIADRNEQGEIVRGIAVSVDVTERKRAEAQLHASAERDRLLGEIARRIRRSLDIREILNTTVEEVRQFLQADQVFIGHLDTDSQGKVVAESVAPNWPSALGLVTNDRYLKDLRALFKGDVWAISNTAESQYSLFHRAYYAHYQIQASLCVPIIVGEEFFGMLIANQCSETRNWQQFEIDLLQQLATQVAIAIQQAQLYEQLSDLNESLERQVVERTAQLEQKMQELQELNRIKDVVLHTVSHDLRTSVQGTVMVLKNLLSQSKETITTSPSIVSRMIQGNERQLGMIDSMLEMYSSEDKGVILHRERLQLNILNQAILKDLEPMLTANQATLTNLVPLDLPLVLVDPIQLERVFENLFTLSLKNNPPGLHLTLNATVKAGMMRYSIQDNGLGMSQVECNRLFDLHIRDPQARCSTSIGLKLYRCRQIITAHGGQIGVTSKPGAGSTIWFTLPLATPSIGS